MSPCLFSLNASYVIGLAGALAGMHGSAWLRAADLAESLAMATALTVDERTELTMALAYKPKFNFFRDSIVRLLPTNLDFFGHDISLPSKNMAILPLSCQLLNSFGRHSVG